MRAVEEMACLGAKTQAGREIEGPLWFSFGL
jgi:hypothetical protein